MVIRNDGYAISLEIGHLTITLQYKSYHTDKPWFMFAVQAINTYLWRTPNHPLSFSNGTTLLCATYDPETRTPTIRF